MKRYFVVVAMIVSIVVGAPSASAVLVDEADTTASLELAAKFPFMCCAAGWLEEGGKRYGGGSGILRENSLTTGTYILTAGHAVDYNEREAYPILKYTFEPSYFDAFPKGSTGFVLEKTIAAQKVIFHPTRDVALVKLEHPVCEADGSFTKPAKFVQTKLVSGQVILFGGNGITGIPSQGGSTNTGKDDGYARCARGIFRTLSNGEAFMDFSRTVPLPGISANGDSGGFAGIENSEGVEVAGVIIKGYGTGEDASTSFEFIDSDLEKWIRETIKKNQTKSAVSPQLWLQYQ